MKKDMLNSSQKNKLFMKVSALSRAAGINMDIESKKEKSIYSELGKIDSKGNIPANSAIVWNMLEKVETRKDALFTRRLEAVLPDDLDLNIQKTLCRKFVAENIVNKNLIADWSIVKKNNQNIFSLLVPAREFEKGEFTKKTRFFDKKGLSQLNKSWKNLIDNNEKYMLYELYGKYLPVSQATNNNNKSYSILQLMNGKVAESGSSGLHLVFSKGFPDEKSAFTAAHEKWNLDKLHFQKDVIKLKKNQFAVKNEKGDSVAIGEAFIKEIDNSIVKDKIHILKQGKLGKTDPAYALADIEAGLKKGTYIKKTLSLEEFMALKKSTVPPLKEKKSTALKDQAFKSMAQFAHIEWKMETLASSGLSQEKKIKLLEPLKAEYLVAAEELKQSGNSLGLSENLIEARTNLHVDFTTEMVEKNINLQKDVNKVNPADQAEGRQALAKNETDEFELLKAAQAVENDPSIENRKRFVDAAQNYTQSTEELMKKGDSIGIPKTLAKDRHERNMKSLADNERLQEARHPTTAESLSSLVLACGRQIKSVLKKLLRMDQPKKENEQSEMRQKARTTL